MAISQRAEGTWADSNATTQTVTIPGGYSAGDMMVCFWSVKPFSASPTIDQSWGTVGSKADGSAANGNGIGSVLTGAFYKVATSGTETNPVITWGTTSAPGAAVIVIFQKGAGESWITPVGSGGGDTTADTSKSMTTDTDPGIVSGDMVLMNMGIRDNCVMTVPTFTTTGVTYAAVVEYPAGALSSLTSNDIAADGCFRLATAGTSSAATAITATLDTNETGSAWITRLRVATVTETRAYAQANAYLKVTNIDAFAQAQASIRQFNINALAQAMANIEQTYNQHAQAQAWILQTYNAYAQAQAWLIRTQWEVAQAQSKIKAIGVTATGQAQANIKQAYAVHAQAQADIKAISYALAQAQAALVKTSQSVAQSQAQIKTIYRGVAQGQADIKATSYGVGQAQTDIKAITFVLAQAQGTIKQTYSAVAQAQAKLGAVGPMTEYGLAQSQANILTTAYIYGQSQAEIKQIYQQYAQSQTWILTINGVFSQAQASILTTYAGWAQSQGYLKVTDNVTFAQAQAYIFITGNAFAQAQAHITSSPYGFAQAEAQIAQEHDIIIERLLLSNSPSISLTISDSYYD